MRISFIAIASCQLFIISLMGLIPHGLYGDQNCLLLVTPCNFPSLGVHSLATRVVAGSHRSCLQLPLPSAFFKALRK
ncbi:MAG: hypothetical protein F6K39_05755 [Okeania sp. SIO3B3]|nr:hypothetical protein [Okeania sp. SIO3B3]